MQELQDKITEVLAGTIASGELDEMIRKKLTKTVDDILDQLLRSWSPLGKAIEKQLEQALAVDLKLGLDGYNKLVADIVTTRVSELVQTEWKVKLERELEEMLRAGPTEIKLSDLLRKLAEDHEAEARSEEWESATILIERESFGSRWVYLDARPRDDDEKYSFEWQLLIDKSGKLYSARHRSEAPHRPKMSSRDLFETHFGFEGLLFKMKAAGTTVVFDLATGLHGHDYARECECP